MKGACLQERIEGEELGTLGLESSSMPRGKVRINTSSTKETMQHQGWFHWQCKGEAGDTRSGAARDLAEKDEKVKVITGTRRSQWRDWRREVTSSAQGRGRSSQKQLGACRF